MNTQKLILSGLLALSLAAISAQAVVLPGSDIGGLDINGAQPGDFILGFRNASAGSDLAVDIGQFSAYRGVAAGTYTVAGFNVAELTSVFGASAFSASTFWTVFGATGNEGLSLPNSSIWATSNSTLARASGATQGSLSNALDTFVNSQMASSSFGGASNGTALSPKSFSALGSGQSAPYSYFGVAVENTTLGSSSLKLWELLPGSGAGTLLGTFDLDSTGLTFTVAAIPEPSVYAAILGAATLGFVAIRRRKQNQLVA